MTNNVFHPVFHANQSKLEGCRHHSAKHPAGFIGISGLTGGEYGSWMVLVLNVHGRWWQTCLCIYISLSYIHVCARMPEFIHAYLLHMSVSVYVYIYFTHIHTYIRTYMHTYIHTIPDQTIPYITRVPTYICTSVHTYIRTYICTYIRTYLHTYIHTYLLT